MECETYACTYTYMLCASPSRLGLQTSAYSSRMKWSGVLDPASWSSFHPELMRYPITAIENDIRTDVSGGNAPLKFVMSCWMSLCEGNETAKGPFHHGTISPDRYRRGPIENDVLATVFGKSDCHRPEVRDVGEYYEQSYVAPHCSETTPENFTAAFCQTWEVIVQRKRIPRNRLVCQIVS